MLKQSLVADRVSSDAALSRPRPWQIRRSWAKFALTPVLLAGLGSAWAPGAAKADDLTDSIFAINNEFLTDTRLTSGLLVAGPPEVAREIAIIDSAMFDAANAASGSPYSGGAYKGTVSGANVDIAALQAGYTALKGIFGNTVWAGVPDPAAGGALVGGSTAIQNKVIASINATYASSLTNLTNLLNPGAAALAASVNLGTAAGTANLVATGYILGSGGLVTTAPATGPGGSYNQIAAGITSPYVPANTNPGTYIPPSTNPAAVAPASARVAMFPAWGTVAPVGLTPAQLTAIENSVPAPPAINSPAYAAALLQTECQGAGTALPAGIQGACTAAGYGPETAAEAKAALFWNDPGTTYQPPGHWLQITDTLAASQSLSTLQASRLGSMVGQAMDDAGIAAWDIKYQYNLWRPTTAINSCAAGTTASWNANFTTCDPGWTSLIATPPHPDYMAGHPAFSGAAATVLASLLGADAISFSSTSDSYCNGGNTFRDATSALVTACGVTSGIYAFNDGTSNTSAAVIPTIFIDGLVYASNSAGCAAVGGTDGSSVYNGITRPSCTIGGIAYAYSPNGPANGCNDVVNAGGANDSALICPITEAFGSISSASSGVNGSSFSRVVGGIHTPFSVDNALAAGDAIGAALVPEPWAIGLLLTAAGLMTMVRRSRRTGTN